jgi:hypothetical protein
MQNRKPLDPHELQRQLEDKYPDLRVFYEDQRLLVRGSFPVLSEQSVIDRFQIEAELHPDFPEETPQVWEVGGRIPRIVDRHTYTNGGSCLLVPEEWLAQPIEERNLASFFGGPVHNYFLYQCFAELGMDWPHGERPHGFKGVLEAFSELLGIEDPIQLLNFLKLLTHEQIKGHWNCPCGSGKIIRRCHISRIRELQERIAPYVAQKSIERLVSTYQADRPRVSQPDI